MKYIYMVRAGESHYKIGVTSNIKKRVKSMQTGQHDKIRVITTKLVDNTYDVESNLHRIYKSLKSDGGTEWFTFTPLQALNIAASINDFDDVDITKNIDALAMLKEIRDDRKLLISKLNRLLSVNSKVKAKSETTELKEPRVNASDAELKLKAMDIFREYQKASTSLLQLELSIGYGRAARIILALEKEGLISEANGNKARKVLG